MLLARVPASVNLRQVARRRVSTGNGAAGQRPLEPGEVHGLDEVIVESGGVNVPAIDTREVTTQVLVNDGQTVVLGGILTTNERNAQTKVPWLGDIPVLGNLFKTTTNTNDKDELLIFVTPKILREGASVN